MPRTIVTATLLCLLLGSPAAALDLLDLFDAEDQRQARRHNVLADNAEVHDVAPPTVFMMDFGSVSRRSACLAGADCSRRPVTAGNYLWAKKRAPWLVIQSYIGRISTDTRLHPKGDLTAFNVVETPAEALRPGGMRIHSFGAGASYQRLD